MKLQLASLSAAVALLAATGVVVGAPAFKAGSETSAVSQIVEVDGRIEVRVRAGFDPGQIANILARDVRGAQVLTDGSTLVVEGTDLAQVKAVLSKAEVERELDDIDLLLAEMKQPGQAEDGSGSSVRAKRELAQEVAESASSEPRSSPLIEGTVTSVKRQRFPLVLVGVEVTSTEEGAPLEAGARATVLPRVRSRRGVVDPDDAQSTQNMGAWYVREGDRVRLRLEPRGPGQAVWVASHLERVKGDASP